MTYTFHDPAVRPDAIRMTIDGNQHTTVTIESVSQHVADLLCHGKKVSLEPIFASEFDVKETAK